MSDLANTAETYLKNATALEHGVVEQREVTHLLRWSVAYALVSIAKSVDELVQHTRRQTELRPTTRLDKLNEEGTEFRS